MTMNGSLSDSYPPGDTLDDRVTNTWRATVVNSNLYVELHTELLLVNSKLSAIMAKLGIVSVRPLPSMRPPADSTHDFESLKVRAEAAAAEGERKPGTDAATEVRRLFEEEEAKRVAARNARVVAEFEAAADQRKADRKRLVFSVIKTVTGGLTLTGAIELGRWLATLHH